MVVDISVPYGADREALGRRSSGEFVQRRLPRTRAVKGWNHVHALHLTAPQVDGVAASVLLAGLVSMMLFVKLGPFRVLSAPP